MIDTPLRTIHRKARGGEANSQLFRFLDAADSMDFVQACKRRMLELFPVHRGDHVLDVGCGLGHEVQRLAKAVGREGRVVGIDTSEAVVAEAERRAARRSLSAEFHLGSADQLVFANDSFDLCRAERVVQYVDEPARMVREMMRVVSRGGSVVCFDFDYDATVIDAADRELMRRMKSIIYNAVPHGGVGSQLPRLFRQVGLEDVQVFPHVFTPPYIAFERLTRAALEEAVHDDAISTEDVEDWWLDLEQSHQEGRFFATFTGFIVGGRKP